MRLEAHVSPSSDQDLGDVIIQKCTSSGLVKTISQQGKGFLLSAEIYDVLHKLLKSDEESATGDVQVMCDGCFLASELHIVTPQKRLEKSQRTLPSPSLAQLRFHLLRGSFPNLTRVTACYFASCSPFRSAEDLLHKQRIKLMHSWRKTAQSKVPVTIFVEMGQLCANKATYTF